MSRLSEILEHNRNFVTEKRYEPFRTDRLPKKRLVLLTCMDTRLVELLPHAMNLRQGDAKVVKCAGAIVSDPFGSVMRSILVAVYLLEAAEVAVVGHHDCGMTGLSCERILAKAQMRGVTTEVLQALQHAGIRLDSWLRGFESPEAGVRGSVELIRHHPLMPRDVPVHGLLIHPETGKLDLIVDGYSR